MLLVPLLAVRVTDWPGPSDVVSDSDQVSGVVTPSTANWTPTIVPAAVAVWPWFFTTQLNTTWVPEVGEVGDQVTLVTIRSIPLTIAPLMAFASFEIPDVPLALTDLTV